MAIEVWTPGLILSHNLKSGLSNGTPAHWLSEFCVPHYDHILASLLGTQEDLALLRPSWFIPLSILDVASTISALSKHSFSDQPVSSLKVLYVLIDCDMRKGGGGGEFWVSILLGHRTQTF